MMYIHRSILWLHPQEHKINWAYCTKLKTIFSDRKVELKIIPEIPEVLPDKKI